jgi:hypothetical protein
MNQPVRKNEDLHGNDPDSCKVVLLLVDVLNDVDFPGAGVPVIYANDNRDKWRSDFSVILAHCLRPDSPGCLDVRWSAS